MMRNWQRALPSIGRLSVLALLTACGATHDVTAAKGPTGGSGATPVALPQPGASAALLDSPNSTVSLTTTSGAQYLVAVVNTDNSASMLEDFTLVGNTGALASIVASASVVAPPVTAGAAARNAPAQRALSMSQHDAARLLTVPANERARAENHLELLAENRRLFAARGSPKAAWARYAAARGRIAPSSASITGTIGGVSKVYVKHSLAAGCTAVDSIGARTVAIGQHVIVLADTDLTRWPNADRPDSSFYQSFADEYDQLTYPHIIANVGDPLAYDGSLSGVGKITVTITPVLNHLTGATGGGSVVAFVNGCDFFPFAASGPDADFSNATEMFYSWVPENAEDVAFWEKGLRATAAHETKHIVSYTDRILNDSPTFEEIWLEEGLAQESAEIWERHFNQATLGGGATFLQTVACEINLGANAPCDAQDTKPLALIVSHLPFFFDYLQTESSSHSEGFGVDTPANYGAGWALARWATDQYGSGSEATFIKALVNEPRLSGLPNLSLHTGQSATTLLVYWNLASAIFQTPTYSFADPRTTTPSFNFADIFRVGQTQLTCGGTPCGIFTQSGVPVFPVQPKALSSGAFASTVTSVPGTSAVFFLLTATTSGAQTLHLTTTAGGELATSSGLRLAILRVK